MTFKKGGFERREWIWKSRGSRNTVVVVEGADRERSKREEFQDYLVKVQKPQHRMIYTLRPRINLLDRYVCPRFLSYRQLERSKEDPNLKLS
jgi:hypothetical protein